MNLSPSGLWFSALVADHPSISPSHLSHLFPPPHVAPSQPVGVGARVSWGRVSWFPPNATALTFAVTGALSELQISYVCREVLQVRRLAAPGLGQGPASAPGHSQPPYAPFSPGTCLSALTEEDTPGH